jgi:hypothetical protein
MDTRSALLGSLIAYLQHTWPRDVIMPVRKGEKTPMFPHKEGTWTWAALREFLNKNRKTFHKYDFCVLLRDL